MKTLSNNSIISEFIEKEDENSLDFDTYLNYNATKAAVAEIENIGILRYYLFLRYSVSLDRDIDKAKDELDTKIEDDYEVASLFNIEEITDMWIFGHLKRKQHVIFEG